ncbi:hypothetical protein T439DRAFT_337654 [Meredithblackwellia eburnea MCA 4105]
MPKVGLLLLFAPAQHETAEANATEATTLCGKPSKRTLYHSIGSFALVLYGYLVKDGLWRLSTAFYIFTLRNDWKDPTAWVRITKIIAMVVNLLSALLAVSTAHGCSLDLLYFGLLVNHKGFDKVCEGDKGTKSNCARKHALIGFSVYVFVAVVVRLYGFLVLWHYDIKWNQGKPGATTNTPAATANPTSKTPASTTSNSLPKFFRDLGGRRGRGRSVKAALEEDEGTEMTKSEEREAEVEADLSLERSVNEMEKGLLGENSREPVVRRSEVERLGRTDNFREAKYYEVSDLSSEDETGGRVCNYANFWLGANLGLAVTFQLFPGISSTVGR